MKKNIFIIAIIALILSSCDSNKTKILKIRGLYSLEIPEFLSETNDLNDYASLQYKNQLREFYVVVIHEPKNEFQETLVNNGLEEHYTSDLNDYTELAWVGLETSLSFDSKPKIKSLEINNLDAQVMDITGTTEGVSIYWKFACIEGRNNYYQVVVWTLVDRREKYQPAIDAIIDSFIETDKSKKIDFR
ncbi:MAG: hypothetical protein BM557_10700 [Flavobacterium sp. MedPE-SWcel]|mgnify:CR=1 FL=1|uniref:hypothetical protein n=1 Tax=uncultured Flavobacterium sp. TaxID=165435 RepID=UPI0009138C41|nr:hypothetical protein [uncultured Flavobacterium sp.]OIQ16016.1 MAG: hypothetical protein BM557_10700 [Flavobacterium sp. MedPE-SWcel]